MWGFGVIQTGAPVAHCLPLGCRIRSEADFHEDLLSAVPVLHVPPEWMLAKGLDTSNHVAEAVKRLTDVALASTLLVISAPRVWPRRGLVARAAGSLERRMGGRSSASAGACRRGPFSARVSVLDQREGTDVDLAERSGGFLVLPTV